MAVGKDRDDVWYEELCQKPVKEQLEAGLLFKTAFNELNFDFKKNFIFDAMHDFLEGVTQLIIKHILYLCVTKKVMTKIQSDLRS